MAQVHEFTVFSFRAGTETAEQQRTLVELGRHLAGCPGLLGRECFHSGADGRWVEHVIWGSEADLEASARLEENPDAARLFERIDPQSVVYVRGEPLEETTPVPQPDAG